MIYLSNEAKLEVIKTLLVFDDVTVWYHNDKKKFEVTPHSMLTSSKEDKTLIGKYNQKDIFKNKQERDELGDQYEKAMRPLYAKTFEMEQ